jgi:hypothetical protein
LIGITAEVLGDDALLAIIRTQSALINQISGQWFTPIDRVWRLDGTRFPILRHARSIPILLVRGVSIDYNSTRREDSLFGDMQRPPVGFAPITSDMYQLSEDYRSLLLMANRFPAGANNVLVDGVMGWWNGYPYGLKYFETDVIGTETVADSEPAPEPDPEDEPLPDPEPDPDPVNILSSDLQKLTLASLSDDYGNGIDVGDIVQLVFREKSSSIHPSLVANKGLSQAELSIDSFVSAVDHELNKITIEPCGAIPSYAQGRPVIKVKTFGPPPDGIRRVCEYLCKREWRKFVADSVALSKPIGETAEFVSRIKSEKVDDYTYTLFSPQELAGEQVYGAILGDPIIDAMLAEFSEPTMLEVI